VVRGQMSEVSGQKGPKGRGDWDDWMKPFGLDEQGGGLRSAIRGRWSVVEKAHRRMTEAPYKSPYRFEIIIYFSPQGLARFVFPVQPRPC